MLCLNFLPEMRHFARSSFQIVSKWTQSFLTSITRYSSYKRLKWVLEEELEMGELIMNWMTFLGGALGALVGFLVIVGVGLLLFLPYFAVTRRDQLLDPEHDRAGNLRRSPQR
jgi:hypothetical protein